MSGLGLSENFGESVGQAANLDDMRSCRVEVREVARLRTLKLVHMLEMQQIAEMVQFLLHTISQPGLGVDMIEKPLDPAEPGPAAEQQSRVLQCL
ncbi:hypothetical protein [Marinovum sp.]|uniref:hypothetical protein n=1 Tax=Marinovum sp. TaxID=2024839 RepID=UPI003A8FFECF